MKKLIEFTKNWKHRNLLHIIGGIIIAFLPNLLLNNFLGIFIGILICIVIAHTWEKEQVKYYKTKYSKKDVLLTMLGGGIIGIIFYIC